MTKAGHLARPLVPTGSPYILSLWVESTPRWGTGGQGFGLARLYFGLQDVFTIHADQFRRSFTRWVRVPVAGSGRGSRYLVAVRHSHFFQYFADVAHQLVSSVGFHVGNSDRDNFRHAQKDFAFGAK